MRYLVSISYSHLFRRIFHILQLQATTFSHFLSSCDRIISIGMANSSPVFTNHSSLFFSIAPFLGAWRGRLCKQAYRRYRWAYSLPFAECNIWWNFDCCVSVSWMLVFCPVASNLRKASSQKDESTLLTFSGSVFSGNEGALGNSAWNRKGVWFALRKLIL